jgi:orotate phosphoribosyltransferase-like protein
VTELQLSNFTSVWILVAEFVLTPNHRVQDVSVGFSMTSNQASSVHSQSAVHVVTQFPTKESSRAITHTSIKDSQQ